jgi:predicted enzyme related to lactoylglutathione lyase
MTLPRVFVGLLVAAMSAACASSGSTAAPPAAAAPSASGTFLWQDLVTTDVKAARAFYTALLGWEFEATRGGRAYLLARTDAGPVGGLVDISGMKDASSHWVSYVRVAGIDRAIQQVEAAGGKVIVPPRTVGVGRAGVIADPQGAPLGLLEPSDAPPGDPVKPVTAHFFWREYLAQDAPKALDFYKSLLSYESKRTDSMVGLEYFVLRHGSPRAGLFQIPSTAANVRPNWLPYVLVDDPSALAAKATGLGGRVLLQPSADRRKGTLAIVADPTGGVVALQKFPI